MFCGANTNIHHSNAAFLKHIEQPAGLPGLVTTSVLLIERVTQCLLLWTIVVNAVAKNYKVKYRQVLHHEVSVSSRKRWTHPAPSFSWRLKVKSCFSCPKSVLNILIGYQDAL